MLNEHNIEIIFIFHSSCASTEFKKRFSSSLILVPY